MSIHINATPGQIAQTVLMPGDPLRAKWIAENFLRNVVEYNSVRNMLGYTGIAPNDLPISVQGSGMGMPSLGIYATELIKDYGVKNIIRVGSAGSLSKKCPLGTVVIAIGACTDSAMNHRRFMGMSYAPIASWNLLRKSTLLAKELEVPYVVGNIVSADKFYEDVEPKTSMIFAEYGALAIEMETAELYTLAAKYGVEALSILTISDELWEGGKSMSSADREKSLGEMTMIAVNL